MVRLKSLLIVLNIAVLVFFANNCSLFTKPDNPPEFKTFNPTAETTTTKIGNTHTVTAEAKDPDGDSFQYKTFKDGSQVNDTNEYTFTIDKKGITKIQMVVYNALSDTLTRYFSAENQPPGAKDTSITMDEESSKTISVDGLGTDTDGDALTYSITSKINVDANIENRNLIITGLNNYFGTASISFNVTDGDLTANGTINIEFTNTSDNPVAEAGEDKTGTIDEDIQLDGSASRHPDDPICSIIDFTWKTLNGDPIIEDSENTIATLRATTSGTYEIELTITDDNGVTAKDTVNVTIDPYKLTVNTTNVLTDAPLVGLDVMFSGKTSISDIEGQAVLEFPTNVTTSGNLEIKDEDVVDDIGDFFNYSDTESTSITGDLELNIEMIPNVEFQSNYYTDLIDFMIEMNYTGVSKTITPGEYPDNYPILINIKENEMPAGNFYAAIVEAIQHINNSFGFEIFRLTTNNDGRYIFDYSRINSSFSFGDLTQINGIGYIGDATVYIKNNLTIDDEIKEVTIHEIGVHGLGWSGHSDDPKDIGSVPVSYNETSGYFQNEISAMEIHLRLLGNTDLNNYEAE